VTATPLVSVVVPAYNCAATVVAAIESALQQSVSDIEVIVVDDGSSDATFEAASSVADARVRVLSQANGGAAAARNTGIHAATGKYVALLDADDLWVPWKLERQLAVLEGPGDVRAAQSGAYFVDDDLQVLSERRCQPSRDALLETLLFQNMPNNMSTLVIARHMFDEMGEFDTSLEILEEWDMAIKVARRCNLVSIEEPLSLYRVHPGNRSRNLDIHIEPGFKVLDRVFADPALPTHIRARRRAVYARFFLMLTGGAFRVRRWPACAYWGARAVVTDPKVLGYILAMPARKSRRFTQRIRARSHGDHPLAAAER
jgi:glycosyltransferase involved in cell wall biosynthesis